MRVPDTSYVCEVASWFLNGCSGVTKNTEGRFAGLWFHLHICVI